jgi:hypothetical protein
MDLHTIVRELDEVIARVQVMAGRGGALSARSVTSTPTLTLAAQGRLDILGHGTDASALGV